MIGGHVEGPHPFLDLQPLRRVGHKETGDTARVAIVAAGAGEHCAVRGDMHPGDPHLLAIDQPAIDAVTRFTHRTGFHVRRIAAVIGLGQAKGDPPRPFEPAEDEFLLLFLRPEMLEHGDKREIADDAVFVLQIIVQPQPARGEPVADHRHPQVRAVLAAILLRRGKPPVARLVGGLARIAEQVLPFVIGQPLAFPIGPRVLAAVVEEADVVILSHQRFDLRIDEFLQLCVIVFQFLRDGEIHCYSSPVHFFRAAASAGYLGTSTLSFSSAL